MENILIITDKKVCEECEGTGRTHYSCCGDDVKGTIAGDMQMCPTCHEHLGDEEDCESCNGTGETYA
jgi:hypothetical protein